MRILISMGHCYWLALRLRRCFKNEFIGLESSGCMAQLHRSITCDFYWIKSLLSHSEDRVLLEFSRGCARDHYVSELVEKRGVCGRC